MKGQVQVTPRSKVMGSLLAGLVAPLWALYQARSTPEPYNLSLAIFGFAYLAGTSLLTTWRPASTAKRGYRWRLALSTSAVLLGWPLVLFVVEGFSLPQALHAIGWFLLPIPLVFLVAFLIPLRRKESQGS